MAAKNNSADEDYLNSLLENVMANEAGDERQENDGIGEELHNKIESDMQADAAAYDAAVNSMSEDSLMAEFDNLDTSDLDDLFAEISSDNPLSSEDAFAENNLDMPEFPQLDESDNVIDTETVNEIYEADREAALEDLSLEEDSIQTEEMDSDNDLMDSLNAILNGTSDTEQPAPEEELELSLEPEVEDISSGSSDSEGNLDAILSGLDLTENDLDILNEEESDFSEDQETLDDTLSADTDLYEKTPKKPKKKNKLLTWLFGDELDPEKEEEERKRLIEQDEKNDEQKKLEKEERAKAKLEEKEKKKQEKEEKKQAKKEAKEAKPKKEKKEKVKKPRTESPNERIKIPAQGWFLIFSIGAACFCGIYFGSMEFHYSRNIKTATDLLVKKDYRGAYDAISGMKLRTDDEKLYEQICLVAYLDKACKSYENFMELDMYGSALDSLLKGVAKYKESNAKAVEIGMSGDALSVYKSILKTLKDKFGLSQKKAEQLVSLMDKTKEYNQKVYDTVNKLTFESAYERRFQEKKQREEESKKKALEEAESKK